MSTMTFYYYKFFEKVQLKRDVTLAYIPLQHETLHVGLSRWVIHPMRDFYLKVGRLSAKPGTPNGTSARASGIWFLLGTPELDFGYPKQVRFFCGILAFL